MGNGIATASVALIREARLPLTDRLGDGLSAPCDVVIADGRIAQIKPSGQRADVTAGRLVLEAAGRVLMPGFIDAHCHAAAAVFEPNIQLALLRQGVTTVVVGQDGIGYAPSDQISLEWSQQYFAGIDGASPRVKPGSLAAWLASYDAQTPLNVAALVPHGSLRYLVAGAAQRPSTDTEIARMCRILDVALLEGAAGLSTGLEYVPAAWAGRDEMVALLRVVARHGRVHSSHMRGYEAAAPGAVAELVDWAKATGVATHIAHYHGDSSILGGLLHDARQAGVPLTFDSYCYLRGASLLSMVSLPTWLPLADPAATLALLANDSGVQTRLADHLAGLADLWPRTSLAWADGADPVDGRGLDWVAGLGLPVIAARLGVEEAEAVRRLLVGTRLRAACIFTQPPTNSAESVMALADRAEHMAGSDAIYVPFGSDGADSGRPHPRGWGGVVRWLAEKTIRGDSWTWGEATQHLASRAADRFSLGDRGRIAVGAVADLILVDPATTADRATYEEPRALATGIDDVLVAGVPVLAGGDLTGHFPGKGIRSQGGAR